MPTRTRRLRKRASIAALCVSLAVMVATGAAQPQRASAIDPAVVMAFDELEAFIAAAPDALLNGGQRRSLIAKLENAEKSYRAGQVCPAWNVLGAYLSETQALRRGARAALLATSIRFSHRHSTRRRKIRFPARSCSPIVPS